MHSQTVQQYKEKPHVLIITYNVKMARKNVSFVMEHTK